jgi:hypothetical protein
MPNQQVTENGVNKEKAKTPLLANQEVTLKNDKLTLQISADIVQILRKHTNSASDRNMVLSALTVAKNLYLNSAPSYLPDEGLQS